MQRINQWLSEIGAAGVIGLGLLLFCVAFYVSAMIPAERELELRRETLQQRRDGGSRRIAASSTDPMSEFYSFFPLETALADELEKVYQLATRQNLELRQGEYRLTRPGEKLAEYRITLPLKGSYRQIRGLIGTTLNELPYVALESVRFERQKVDDPAIDAQLRLVLYLRRSV